MAAAEEKTDTLATRGAEEEEETAAMTVETEETEEVTAATTEEVMLVTVVRTVELAGAAARPADPLEEGAAVITPETTEVAEAPAPRLLRREWWPPLCPQLAPSWT